MRIMKFGGTSLKDATCFLHVSDIIEKKIKNEQVGIVLSAPSGVTNNLKIIIDKSINKKNIDSEIHTTKNIFLTLLDHINQSQLNFPYNIIKQKILDKFIELKKNIHGINLLGQCPDNIYAKILCQGEIISVSIMKGILQSRNYSITVINPVDTLLSTNNYLEATVNIIKSTARIKKIQIPKKNIILMAGFIGGNENKELVLFGRNGSDYSAAILSACLQANYCEIWTDVNGIYTCDPRQVSDAKLLKEISYQEAIEFSYFGAKVLHPRTIAPILQFKIPCIIKNTFQPNNEGTLICSKPKKTEHPIKGITYLNNIAMFCITTYNMHCIKTITSRIFTAITRNKVSIILNTQSPTENSINIFVLQQNILFIQNILEKEFTLELKNKILKKIKIIKELAILSIIGINKQYRLNISARFFLALANLSINTIAISQFLSNNTISIVIEDKHLINKIKTIHRILFDTKYIAEIFLIGVGGIGSTLLQQISLQQKKLQIKDINLKICGIANSKKLHVNMKGIPLNKWHENLKKENNTFSLKKIIDLQKKYHLINPVLIDCTADEKLAYQYVDVLNKGFHVITSNKKANTADLIYYKKIRLAALKYKKKFLYETNVGAGLPVIETIQNLINSGDELIHFRGILSGSLSFIFGQLEIGVPLSQATQEAKDMGFTEPNPHDDLSGIDVARKVLILAREMGYSVELQDIKIDSLLPVSFNNITDVNNFMHKLKELDPLFTNKVKKAQNTGKVLRLIGTINKIGKCQVKIDEVDENDPLYKIKNGENALAFYSKYYQPIPLVLRGYGAGNNVTAAGIFSDLLHTLSEQSGV
ncbi:bifunctional aspartate kinase/homoserine dehydrogenase I [Buchnera aphidicola]|uniref:bifunctional aspartate kinase/homoserine dehydrogenase I n=1 Tax=Buchnera aphidicola TaxID=9 RepID=UPI0031B849F6